MILANFDTERAISRGFVVEGDDGLEDDEWIIERSGREVEAAAELALTLQAFVEGCDAGLFQSASEAADLPMQASVESLPPAASAALRWRLSGMSSGCIRVLVNLLLGAVRVDSPTGAVRVLVSRRRMTAFERSPVAALPFTSSSSPPFGVMLKNRLALSNDCMVRIEFEQKVSDIDLERVRFLLGAWDGVVARGGYFVDAIERGPVEDALTLAESAQTYRASASTVEHLLYQPAGSIAAYDALVNVVMRIDRTIAAVVQLDVE